MPVKNLIYRQAKEKTTMAVNEKFDELVTYTAEELRAAKSELVKEFGMTWAQFKAPGEYQKFLQQTDDKSAE